MKQTILEPSKKVPTANLAVNKSRIKVYNKEGDLPTYYLQGGQEFQIELFNPTQNTVLAKIILNGKPISQGGLVLKPGVRVFLDRYLDVAKKFLFDTYEVSGTSDEVKEAIAKNGDFKVQFYNESKPYIANLPQRTIFAGPYNNGIHLQNINTLYSSTNNTTASGSYSQGSGPLCNTTSFTSSFHDGTASMDGMLSFNSMDGTITKSSSNPLRSLKSKSIETGRVEKGSTSNQKLNTVDIDFEYFAFHTVEYKMLPVSQKINEVGEIFIKRYCTNCGGKLTKGDKFCSNCGTKA